MDATHQSELRGADRFAVSYDLRTLVTACGPSRPYATLGRLYREAHRGRETASEGYGIKVFRAEEARSQR
jgi:hypothetical protein